jgi:hypothetical protein
MSRLIFKADDVRRVVEHTIRSKQSEIAKWDTATEENGWTPDRAVPDEPHVILVHDDGVYLMSNGTPRDIIGPDGADMIDRKKDEGRSFVAYAKGCHPKVDSDWWETSRWLVGGDDFGEYLPWAKDLLARLDAGAHQIVIECNPNSLELVTP